MSEDFPEHCMLGVTHVAQQSLREKLRLLPSSNPTDLLPLQDPNVRPTTTSLCDVPSTLYANPSLLLDFPNPDGANPPTAMPTQPDWLMSYAAGNRYQDLQTLRFPNLYPTSNIALEQLPSQLLHQPFPGNEQPLVPAYTTTTAHHHHHHNKEIGCDASTHGLTLSLASAFPQEPQLGLLHEVVPAAIGKGAGGHCAIGPLGPFTGYATILQSSKYLKPAQQLLDECCTPATGVVHGKTTDLAAFRRGGALEGGGCGDLRGASNVGSSSSRCSVEGGMDGGHGGLHRAEIQERKAKLLVLQGEVCRRYKQYKQQIQMAISSFDSVAGLSGAIPFMSAAVKTVSRHFRFLKNVISEQVIQISRALGEEISSSSLDNSERATTSRSRFLEQTLRRQKAEESGLSVLENNQPIWRPQRGLPERAVAVLRAWLFDHFLHPYPTDTDKLMLAQQTGLTRNQVSNWFINARVRVWKPMVEEIHMLETKGLTERDLNSKNDTSQPSIANQDYKVQHDQQSACNFSHLSQAEPSFHASPSQNIEHWPIEKRSRMEAGSSGSNVASQFADLSAYPGGIDMGGLGSVSLTLALRQDEGAWQQQYQQMRPYFGGQMIND